MAMAGYELAVHLAAVEPTASPLRDPYTPPPIPASHPFAPPGHITGTSPGVDAMMDLVFVAAGLAFFGVMAGYARWAARN